MVQGWSWLLGRRGSLAAVGLLAVLVYANTLIGDFTFDDNFAVVRINTLAHNTSLPKTTTWEVGHSRQVAVAHSGQLTGDAALSCKPAVPACGWLLADKQRGCHQRWHPHQGTFQA